ncbi:MAG: hypothetical protein IPK15_18280 [Verrucomicrobia bacterium]|nr:hypothetical protein [Verrucomicrobiota bacterium]
MRSSTFVLLIAVAAFTGVLCWVAATPWYLVDKQAASAYYHRMEEPEVWRRTQERLAKPRFIANATLSALAAVDVVGIWLIGRAWRRDRRQLSQMRRQDNFKEQDASDALNPPPAPRDSP